MKISRLFALSIAALAVAGCGDKGLITPYTAVKPEVISIPESDLDRDGVIDRLDQCPGTPTEYAVDEVGCHMYKQLTVSMELEIQFANDSSVVEESYYGEIERVADFLREHPEAQVEIAGHTSVPASELYNQALSERRAQEVAQILIDHFEITAERVSFKGYGETRLKDLRDVEAAHAINRRIEAVIFGVEQAVILRAGQE